MSHYTTFEERLEIENGLRENLSFGEIAKRLSKDRSTISREVKKYAVVEKSGYGAAAYNACVHRPNCTKNHVCKGECSRNSVKYCKLCGRCNDFCLDFEEQTCIIRLKPPYVCNACEERNRCTLEKTLYSATAAQKVADRNISESRRGVFAAESKLTALNEFGNAVNFTRAFGSSNLRQ